MISEALIKIVDKQDLSYDKSYQVIENMAGATTQTQTAAFLHSTFYQINSLGDD